MKYFTVFLLMCHVFSFGQVVRGSINFPNAPFDVLDYGSSYLNVYYSFNEKDFNKNQQLKTTLCVLEIGEDCSKFVDSKQLKYDSLQLKFKNLKTLGAQELNELLRAKVDWEKTIIKEKEKNIIQSKLSNIYQYEVPKPNWNWKIENENKYILGYACRKASTKFKGRTYEVWYATDIPISDGPYQLQGLPGLILEATDMEGIFHFEAIAINKKQMPIYLFDRKSNLIKTSEKKYKEVEKNEHENPGAYLHGKAYDADGKQIVMKLPSIPYNPIELE